jgi:hypothetical protein
MFPVIYVPRLWWAEICRRSCWELGGEYSIVTVVETREQFGNSEGRNVGRWKPLPSDIGREVASWEILVAAITNCRLCKSVMLLFLLVTNCNCSITRITNPGHIYELTYSCQFSPFATRIKTRHRQQVTYMYSLLENYSILFSTAFGNHTHI